MRGKSVYLLGEILRPVGEKKKLSRQPMRGRMAESQEVSRSHSTHRDCEEGQNGNKLLKRRKVGQCIESRKL
jgi:hypothetical protein